MPTRPRGRSGWNRGVANAIWDRDEGCCVYCGGYASVIDHIFPVKAGGPTIKANGVLACGRCNYRKAAKLNIDQITRAFFHLLNKGESLEWIDKLIEEDDRPRIREAQASYTA